MSKKEKLLADAQKMLQKGLADKAISCYQEAVAADPGDQRVRQRLAELLAKSRRNDEARKEFEVIGRTLTANGFYLKAIAVYKQIEKLFPDDIGLALTLAGLNEKHGLTANALAEYKRAYDYYEKLQNHAEALKALEAMQRIDAQNPNIKLKYAEVLLQQGKQEEALEAFKSLGMVLVGRRDDGAFVRLTERVMQLFKDAREFDTAVIKRKIDDGSAEQAAALLHALIKTTPQRFALWQLLIEAYRSLGNNGRLKAVCQHLLKNFPSEPLPIEQLIRCLIEDKETQAALSLLEENEQLLINAGMATILGELYLALNNLVPINQRILEGCARADDAAGNAEQAATWRAKIAGLSGLGQAAATAAPVDEEAGLVDFSEPEIELGYETQLLEIDTTPVSEPTVEAGPRELDIDDFAESSSPFDAGFYEIEVELDDDLAPSVAVPANNWFETVNDIFGTIQTETGKVRFGAGMDNGDAQSHYDLGMAFHEMGLYDEAINALRQAAEDPARRVACLILQGACLRDKGELQLSENALRALLALPTLSVEDSCALKYELALTCTVLGKSEEAWKLLEEVEQVDPAYRDVSARLHDASEGKTVGGLDFSEDELLDFELK